MGEIIIKNVVKRKPGYLYYIDKDGNLCEAELKNGKKEEPKNDILSHPKGWGIPN